MYIVIWGNPGEGFTFHGPFAEFEDAEKTADRFDGDWWVATLQPPTDD